MLVSETPVAEAQRLITSAEASRLVWRCRRGMLENDLFTERFFRNHAQKITVSQARALLALMELSDNDLLDLHLGRKAVAEVSAPLDTPEVNHIISLLKTKAPA